MFVTIFAEKSRRVRSRMWFSGDTKDDGDQSLTAFEFLIVLDGEDDMSLTITSGWQDHWGFWDFEVSL